jgi:hypothetical protein
MDILDFEGIAIISMIIFELILFVKTSIDLFKNTWWNDDMDGL